MISVIKYRNPEKFRTYDGISPEYISPHNVESLEKSIKTTNSKHTRKGVIDTIKTIIKSPESYDPDVVYEGIKFLIENHIDTHGSKNGNVPQYFINKFNEIFPVIISDKKMYATSYYCAVISTNPNPNVINTHDEEFRKFIRKPRKCVDRTKAATLEPSDVHNLVESTLGMRFENYKKDAKHMLPKIWTPDRAEVLKKAVGSKLMHGEINVMKDLLSDIGCNEENFRKFLQYLKKSS